jgi:hypothetical protein
VLFKEKERAVSLASLRGDDGIWSAKSALPVIRVLPRRVLYAALALPADQAFSSFRGDDGIWSAKSALLVIRVLPRRVLYAALALPADQAFSSFRGDDGI